MASQYPILNIERAPGDSPRAVEQLNGDLLVPANARPLLAQAVLLAQEAIPLECTEELARLEQVRRLLGVVRVDTAKQTLLANLGKIRPV
jgi:hypothetical protein